MAGRTLRGMLRTADYKDGKALKSCHTEFIHIYGAAFHIIRGYRSSDSLFSLNILKNGQRVWLIREKVIYLSKSKNGYNYGLQ